MSRKLMVYCIIGRALEILLGCSLIGGAFLAMFLMYIF